MAEENTTQRQHTGRIKDARGRNVTQLDPITMRLLRQHDVIPAEPLAEVAADLGSGLTKLTRFFFVLGIVFAAPGVIAFVIHLTRIFWAGGMVWPLPTWLLLANVWVVPFAIWIAACQLRSRRIRSVMLKHLRCPHCGYDIRGLPAAVEDGATVCPECGCAWRLDETADSGGASSTERRR